MKNFAVILSGCGFKDGSEITEAISCLIHLSQLQVKYQCFAPDINFTSINHITGTSQESRNILLESSRISRGSIMDLKKLNEKEYDGLIFPGGFGAALHLCSWAKKGAQCEVIPEVSKNILAFFKASKPIGAICIAPGLLAKVLGGEGITITIGKDAETIAEIIKTGALHEECMVDDFISDRANKIITTPAYMFEAQPHQAFTGIGKLVRELVEMA